MNYNDVERTKTARFIFNVFRICSKLLHVSFIGNTIKPQLIQEYKLEFEKTGRKLTIKEDLGEDEEEEIEDEEPEELSEDDEDEEDSEAEDDATKELEKMFQDLHLE